LQKAVRAHEFCYQDQKFPGQIDICFGLATYRGVNGGANKFIDSAGCRLYKMKKSCKQKEA